MRYHTILVHLQLGRSHAALLQLAGRLADRFGARIIGVAASAPLQALIAEGCTNGPLVEDELDELRREMALAEQAFYSALGERAECVEWRANSRAASVAGFVAEVARGADLILTDAAPGGPLDTQRQLQVSELLMRAGRPVLIAPASAGPLLFMHALLAWDDSRECRRAAVDALPLLRDAARVSIVQVADDNDHGAVLQQLESVAAWLRSHDVGAHAVMLPPAGGPPRLGAIALDQACDLIVAGAYGHSRLREWALGGVTRALVAQQQVAVLLSH